jgi:uncharacterized protein (DUF2249 family)
MNSKIHTLDVREDFCAGQHPCDKIQNALSGVVPGEALRLLVPFKPEPLFQVAARQGLGHQATQASDGHWEVLFTHDAQAAATAPAVQVIACECAPPAPTETRELDVRGLEPPQPMVRILELLATLPEGVGLLARTDRRPVHLLPQLEFRGFSGTSEEQPDGSFITHIRRS